LEVPQRVNADLHNLFHFGRGLKSQQIAAGEGAITPRQARRFASKNLLQDHSWDHRIRWPSPFPMGFAMKTRLLGDGNTTGIRTS
jgi:hypothetical protein